MHPYFASRIGENRQDELRRLADTSRLLAEVRAGRRRRSLLAYLRGAGRLLRPAGRYGPRARRPVGSPVPRPGGL